jgi:hypothetical protein
VSKQHIPRIVNLDPPQPCAACGQHAVVGTVEPLPSEVANLAPGGLLLLPMCEACLDRVTSSFEVDDGIALSA